MAPPFEADASSSHLFHRMLLNCHVAGLLYGPQAHERLLTDANQEVCHATLYFAMSCSLCKMPLLLGTFIASIRCAPPLATHVLGRFRPIASAADAGRTKARSWASVDLDGTRNRSRCDRSRFSGPDSRSLEVGRDIDEYLSPV